MCIRTTNSSECIAFPIQPFLNGFLPTLEIGHTCTTDADCKGSMCFIDRCMHRVRLSRDDIRARLRAIVVDPQKIRDLFKQQADFYQALADKYGSLPFVAEILDGIRSSADEAERALSSIRETLERQ